MLNVGIAGKGILGQLLAYSLIQEGCQVTFFDEAKNNNCSMAAAGLLTPIGELERSDPLIYELGMSSLECWPHILNKLNKDIYFKKDGSLTVAHKKDEAELLRFANTLTKKINKQCSYLAHEEIKLLEPDIANLRGYYFSEEGQIDNQQLLTELNQYLLQQKVKWIAEKVHDIQSGMIKVENQIYYFDYVFDCRGLGAKQYFNNLRGIRGELIWLYAPNVNIKRPIRYLHPRYALYIVPRPNHVYLIGSSEIESEDTSQISVRTTLELLSAAYSIQPKFSEARIVKTISQLRPTLLNHLPKIKYKKQLLAINGLYRHGFLITPMLVNEVLNFLKNGLTKLRYPTLFQEIEG